MIIVRSRHVGTAVLLSQVPQPAQGGPPNAVPEGFVAISGASPEAALNPGPLVLIAYALFFLLLLGYVMWLGKRLIRLREEVDDLERRLAARDGAADPARGRSP